jgi:photosystem II stability/assembly factor-like uncharacterized protein
MKIKFLLLLVLSFLTGDLYSQFQWRLLPDSPGITGSSRNEDIHFINENTGWCVGYTGEVYRTVNGGANWTTVFNSTFGKSFRSVGFFDENTGILGTLISDSNKVLYRTTNSGFNWTAVTNISGTRPQGICGINIVNENLAYACGRYFGSGRIIKTTDKGLTWNLVFSDTVVVKALIDIYFWSPDSGIAVGGNSANLLGNAVIIKTTNGGVSWVRVHVTPRQSEWCWKISFINVNTGFVSIERGSGFAYILKTTNSGNNWTEIPFRNYDEEGIGFVNENTGWVGGWTGPTYQTTNGGANWSLAGWGTNLNRFRFLSDTLAYAVGDRIYKYSRNPVGIQNISTEIPVEFSLKQNYPNPFNPTTNLEFGISELGFVTLKIYNSLGLEVATIVNETLTPGTYNYQFSTINYQLASGIYFYKLEAGSFTETKRMILLK